jgi:hypothetical protein
MTRFEVQQLTICDGWINTWHEYDDDNNEVPMMFDSFGEALDELDDLLNDCQKEFERGNIDSPYDRNEFRIVEVKNV